jgi:hypothetical protein
MRNGQGQGVRKETPEESDAVAQARPMMAEDTIDQVRELLFGHEKRRTEQNLTELRAEFAASVDDLRAEMRQQVDMLTARLIDLDKTTEKRRLESISDIGQAISDLGARIQNMGASAPKR